MSTAGARPFANLKGEKSLARKYRVHPRWEHPTGPSGKARTIFRSRTDRLWQQTHLAYFKIDAVDECSRDRSFHSLDETGCLEGGESRSTAYDVYRVNSVAFHDGSSAAMAQQIERHQIATTT